MRLFLKNNIDIFNKNKVLDCKIEDGLALATDKTLIYKDGRKIGSKTQRTSIKIISFDCLWIASKKLATLITIEAMRVAV